MRFSNNIFEKTDIHVIFDFRAIISGCLLRRVSLGYGLFSFKSFISVGYNVRYNPILTAVSKPQGI